ncbi:ASCH domain-containing protein [Streptococcus hongkongensis]|nr:RNA-binding protein [Streptococcus uberis]
MQNSSIEKYWKKFKSENNIDTDNYEAWQFGFDADLLGNLVLEGKKTATASAFDLYDIAKEELPKVGEYNIILNAQNEPLCITKTTKVYVVPFDQVSANHAYKEGENDRTLDSWRKGHEAFFKNEFKAYNIAFTNQIDVVCEEFEVVYKSSF